MSEASTDKKTKRLPRVRVKDSVSVEELREEARKRSHSTAKKLLALADVVDGKSYTLIARANAVSKATIYYWIHCLNKHGVENFDRVSPGGRLSRLGHGDISLAKELAELATKAPPKDATKLQAISQVLSMSPCREVSRRAQVAPSTLSRWIKTFSERGISGLLGKEDNLDERRVKLRGDTSLKEIGAVLELVEPRFARRARAMVFLIEGKTMEKIAEELGVSKSTVSKWCRKFNEEGLGRLVGR
jgi:transposase